MATTSGHNMATYVPVHESHAAQASQIHVPYTQARNRPVLPSRGAIQTWLVRIELKARSVKYIVENEDLV